MRAVRGVRRILPHAAALALAACGSAPQTNMGDRVDPAATAAVGDPIMTDTELKRRSNADVLRPADEPFQALVPPGDPDPLRGNAPPTIAARMAGKLSTPPFAGCSRQIGYSYGWASRLPDGLTLPANTAVAEAAGSDTAGCGLRMVAFSADTPPGALVEHFRRLAAATGMRIAESDDGPAKTLSATSSSGTAFVATIYPASNGSGSNADLLSNRGR